MSISIFTAVTWLMFLGLFPLSFVWLRRAWLVGIKKDYSYVALKFGNPPENPEKYVIITVGVNLIAGLILGMVVLFIIVIALEYDTWTAIVGTTIWMKLFIEFIISRHAHGIFKKLKNKNK